MLNDFMKTLPLTDKLTTKNKHEYKEKLIEKKIYIYTNQTK